MEPKDVISQATGKDEDVLEVLSLEGKVDKVVGMVEGISVRVAALESTTRTRKQIFTWLGWMLAAAGGAVSQGGGDLQRIVLYAVELFTSYANTSGGM